jgi:hypothetical protein
MAAPRLWAPLALAAAMASCNPRSPETARAEAARLRTSFEPHRSAYIKAIEAENLLVPETLAWLDTELGAKGTPRSASQACRLMDRWAAVYFGPRVIQMELRFDQYRSAEVSQVQRRMLEHLRQRYFLLHEYQRYAQAACDAGAGAARQAQGRAGLAEFRSRLAAHPQQVDEVSPLLGTLPR